MTSNIFFQVINLFWNSHRFPPSVSIILGYSNRHYHQLQIWSIIFILLQRTMKSPDYFNTIEAPYTYYNSKIIKFFIMNKSFLIILKKL